MSENDQIREKTELAFQYYLPEAHKVNEFLVTEKRFALTSVSM